jgi:uncharacterized protein (TIGR00645 family)
MPQIAPTRYRGALASLIFLSRWLQAPLYLGLIVPQGVYVYHFLVELGHLLEQAQHIDEKTIMLTVLGLIDVVMIANLLIMVIVGGYETFVSRLRLEDHPDQPEWLSHVNAGVLKVKLATALIGISSIHLKTSIEIGTPGCDRASRFLASRRASHLRGFGASFGMDGSCFVDNRRGRADEATLGPEGSLIFPKRCPSMRIFPFRYDIDFLGLVLTHEPGNASC